jgi:translation initiation factor 2 beta subunit (eIF-2beta)/eIF-5
MINLTDNENDNYCRYVIPIPQIQIVGKHFTKISNLNTICDIVNLKTDKLMKILGKDLGTYSISNRLIGVFEPVKLRKLIVSHIKQLITCPNCNLPEVNNGLCKACYWSGSIY